MDIIFCGNPGVGKSTLLSSISNLPFRSGFSWGEGLTSELSFKTHPDLAHVRFADTPGLADITKAESASAAITTALADGAEKRAQSLLFFVVTVEAGRIRPDDLFTIKQVMESITLRFGGGKPGPNSYGVIFNKCTFLDDPGFMQGGKQKLERLFAFQSEAIPFTTTYLHFLPNVPQLVDQSNCKHLFEGLVHWVFAFPGIEIGSVEKIDVSDMESKLQKLKEVHTKEVEELEMKISKQNDVEKLEMKKMMEESRNDMERKIRRVEEERRRNTSFFEQLHQFITIVVSALNHLKPSPMPRR